MVVACVFTAWVFGIAAVGASSGVSTGSTEACCAAVQKVLSHEVYYPGSNTSVYAASIASYWSLVEQDLHPFCVVRPTNKNGVAAAVKTLAAAVDAQGQKCQFAVRSGGHTPWSGAANIQKGVTIDLSVLNRTTIAGDKKSIDIGPGARWEGVYQTLAPQGLGTSGGRVSPVGVGGLTTGGGISFFSPIYGFVCDNVISFEVVVANGSIVNANANSNPDLWRGLRGGSGNFGIVTNFKMRTFSQGNFWGGNVGQSIDVRQKIFNGFAALNGNYSDPYPALISSCSISQKSPVWFINNAVYYTKSNPAVVDPPVLRNFTRQPNKLYNTLRTSNITDFTAELFAANSYGTRQTFVTSTFRNSAAMMEEVFQITNKTTQSIVKRVPGLTLSVTFQPLPTAILSKAKDLGGNSLGLDPAKTGNLVNVLLTASWTRQQDDQIIETTTRSIFACIEAKAKQLGVYNPFLYLNYADKWQQPIQGYGAEEVKKLQAVSRKYDPHGVFQKQVPGGFKLPSRQ